MSQAGLKGLWGGSSKALELAAWNSKESWGYWVIEDIEIWKLTSIKLHMSEMDRMNDVHTEYLSMNNACF